MSFCYRTIVTICVSEPRYPVKSRPVGTRQRREKQGSKQDPENTFRAVSTDLPEPGSSDLSVPIVTRVQENITASIAEVIPAPPPTA